MCAKEKIKPDLTNGKENIEFSDLSKIKDPEEQLREFKLKEKLKKCVYDWADETSMVG